jgi:Tetratricopeptide repeat
MRLYIPLLVVITVYASSSMAAEPSSSADALVEQGISLRQKGQNQEALELFQRAHALAPSGRTLAQIGVAEATLQRWIDAETHLAAALDSHDTPWIQNAKNRAALEKSLMLVRAHIAEVSIVGPAGAEISVGGSPAGRLPLAAPLHLPEGRTRIEGSADGRESKSIDLRIPGGHELILHLDLPMLPSPFEAPAAVTSTPAPPSLIDTSPVPESTTWKTWTGGGLLAVSAGLIATGIIWVAVDGNNACSPPAGKRCMNVYNTKTQGWITAGAGAVAGVVGGILLWQGHQSETRIGLGLGTLTAAGTF